MPTSRHQRILSLLNERGFLAAGETARLFGVTPMTVWRDFAALAELGLLRRVRGGARAIGAGAGEPAFEEKERAELAIKARIAACAVGKFVREGDVIVLEGGTTVAAMIPHLPEARVSVLTNSLPVALQVRTLRPNLPVRMVGGWLSAVSGNLTGAEAVREIGHLAADVCFIGATGFDGEVGPSDPNPLEIEVKRAWASIARRTVMLLDAGKFGRRTVAVTLHPKRLHALVTHRKPDTKIAALLKAHHVELHVAGS
jgi:DeoR/GlpR family transcriptional regulator of sugar metabolism